MGVYRFVTDSSRCIACRACEAACKVQHDSAPGIFLGRLLADGPRFAHAVNEAVAILPAHRAASLAAEDSTADPSCVVLHTRFRACLHCANPRCVSACPHGALQCREADGLVFVESARCTGCQACQRACPHHLLWTDPRTGKVVKCDWCKDRLDAGLSPACVTVCPTQALSLQKKSEASHAVAASPASVVSSPTTSSLR